MAIRPPRATWAVLAPLAISAVAFFSGACGSDERAAATKPLAPATDGEFTLVVIPDTQFHVIDEQQTFLRQTRWIVDNAVAHNIAYVLHEGDIVNWNKPHEWRRARAAMQLLDDARIPYALTVGNHDMSELGSARDRETGLFNKFFASERPAPAHSGLAGTFEPGKLDNSYHLFSAQSSDWMIIALEFGPRDEVLAWAARLCEQHRDRRVIILTHAYQNRDGTRQSDGDRFNPRDKGMRAIPGNTINDGELMWNKLIRRHGNIDLVVSGHMPGVARQRSEGDGGHVVHEILANYQELEKQDRNGWLRIMRINPATRQVDVWTYSALADRFWTNDANQFSVQLDVH